MKSVSFLLLMSTIFAFTACEKEDNRIIRKGIPMSPQQLVPALAGSNATGTIDIEYFPDGKTLHYTVHWNGLLNPLTNIKVFQGASGINGTSIDNGFIQPSFTTSGSHRDRVILKDEFEDFEDDFLKGEIYIVIQTQNNPNGELRGQLVL